MTTNSKIDIAERICKLCGCPGHLWNRKGEIWECVCGNIKMPVEGDGDE